MRKIAIFRTISHKQHPLVWEKSHISNYDNSKSKLNTLEQIFTWSPDLKNSCYKSEDVKFGIGLYCARYYEQRYKTNWRQEYQKDEDYYPSILHVRDLDTHNGFIAHENNIIYMHVAFHKKLKLVDSISLDTILCDNALRLMKTKFNQDTFHVNDDRRKYNIGDEYSGATIFPLFYLLDDNDFFDIIQSPPLNLLENHFTE